MKPARLVLLLLLVLSGHWLGLVWLSRQLPDLQPLIPLADPLLTRLIVPTRSPNVPRERVKPPPARARAVARRAAPAEPQAEPALQAAAQAAQDPQQTSDPVAAAVATDLAQTTALAASAAQLAQAPELALPAADASAPVTADATPVPETWPPDTRVSYALTGNYRGPLQGSARVQWQRESNRYQVRIDLRLALIFGVSMISQGEVSEAGLQPQVYEEQLLGSVRRLAVQDGWVKFNDASQKPAPAGVQDTASQLVELSQRFASGRAPLKVGTPVQVWLARPQGMALWTYDVVAEELLATPELGAVAALHLVPRPIANPTGVITAEIWFAPSLRYLPVRIRISLGAGNFIDLMVERVEQAAQAG